MTKKRTTLRDIAKAAGVSAVTVHKVLYAKGGVSEAMRLRILEIAESMRYSVNTAASSLKRKPLHIVVILQNLSSPESYFFRQMWKGVERAERRLLDYSVRITRLECGDDWRSQEKIMQELALREDVDGIVLNCWDETRLNPVIDYLYEKGIPVVTANSDAIDSRRVACVSAPNKRVGCLAAELMCGLLPGGGRLLIAGGQSMVSTHRDNRAGFRAWMKARGTKYPITEIVDREDESALAEALAEAFSAHPVRGIYAITSRDTYRVCRIAEKTGLTGRAVIVGSDVFEELAPWFENGTLAATVWKDQQAQAEQAILLLYRHLTKQSAVAEPIQIGIVMRNNLEDYL